jgi:hypothetical protein
MSWKGVKEENQMEICTEKYASMHRFLCMPYGMKTVTFIQKVFNKPAYELEWKTMSRLDRPDGSDVLETKGGQTNRLPLSKLRY